MAVIQSVLANRQSGPRRVSPMVVRNTITGLLFISPWLIGMLVFTLYPMVASLFYSFTSYDIVNPPSFIGLENFRTLFFEDDRFLKSIANTFQYAFVAIPLGLLVSFLIALLLNMKVRFQAMFRTIFI